MSRVIHIALLLAAVAFSIGVQAQSDELPLGDLARSLRKNQAPPAKVIDNDNLPEVMEQGENKRWAATARRSPELPRVNPPAADITCALSFSGHEKNPLDDAIRQEKLPASEISKLDGPASIVGGSLQISVRNGTDWDLREITVGFTVVRRQHEPAFQFVDFKLVPAVSDSPEPTNNKHPDTTVLYHLKGSGAPSSTTVFEAPVNVAIGPDQEWHWAIVAAKGIPPAEPLPPASSSDPLAGSLIQAPN